MKRSLAFCVFLLSVAPVSPAHALLATNENATDELGQFASASSDTAAVYTKDCINNGASQIGFDHPSAIAMDGVNHRLFVAEYNNNRVLVFTLTSGNQISTKTPAHVLGQTDFSTCAQQATSASSITTPLALAFDSANNRLFVGEDDLNRVLVFNTSSITDGMNASYVLGKPDFVTTGTACTQSTGQDIAGLAYDSPNSRLFAARTRACNRVMVYNVAPASIANGENASYVLGQTNFTSNGAATTQTGLNVPYGLALDSANNVLYVADQNNSRVLTFNVATGSIANGENASNVVGQTSFTASGSNDTQSGLTSPEGLAFDSANSRLFVADADVDRMMVFSTSGITNGENASYVLGQPDFVTDYFGSVTQSDLRAPEGVAYDSTNNQLWVADTVNNRLMLFATSSISNGENASDLLGQYNSTTSTATVVYTNNGENNGPTALGFYNPGNSALDPINHRLFVADSGNNRVLVYNLNTDNSISTASGGHTASYVLGQANLNSGGSATTQSGMNNPTGVAFDSANNRLFVADYNNSRVLVFSTSTITNGMNASNELGQASGAAFTTNNCSDGQFGLCLPGDVAYDAVNSRLFVADTGSNRVVVFNVATGTIANGENASYVLGQTAFGLNGHAHTKSTLYRPDALAYDAANTRLFVADASNNRVMVFNVATGTIANGENALNVLGNASFTTVGSGACSQTGINNPGGVAYDPNHYYLFVGNSGNSRVTVFNVAPATITNGENASYVLGAPNLTSCNCNTNPPAQNGLCFANYLMYDPGSSRLFVDDAYDSSNAEGNNRIMIFDGGILPTGDYFNP